MKKKKYYSKLLKETMELMNTRSVTTTVSSIQLNTTLEAQWLYSFSAGRYEDYGVNKVEELNNYLKKVLKNG